MLIFFKVSSKMRKVFVGSLSWSTDDQSLNACFSKVGQIEESVVIKDRETGRSRGFGFVTYAKEEDAILATERLDGMELDGREIKVSLAQDRDARPKRTFASRY